MFNPGNGSCRAGHRLPHRLLGDRLLLVGDAVGEFGVAGTGRDDLFGVRERFADHALGLVEGVLEVGDVPLGSADLGGDAGDQVLEAADGTEVDVPVPERVAGGGEADIASAFEAPGGFIPPPTVTRVGGVGAGDDGVAAESADCLRVAFGIAKNPVQCGRRCGAVGVDVAVAGEDVGVAGRRWQDLAPMEVQRVVAGLLVRIHPDAYAIDGSGGDDGADVVAPVKGGVHVFEVKSFTSRLTRGQKQQIKKSLTRARDSRPDMTSWTLAVPLDPSPAEERWFYSELPQLVNVSLNWMGLTQLEAALAEHPHIAREFWPGSATRTALELLADYHQEQAALGAGVPDALERGRKLQELLREVDPDFNFDLQLSDGQTIVGVRPRDDLVVCR